MTEKENDVIKKLKRALGALVGPSEWAPLPVVIGSVEQSESGNAVLRVGKMTIEDPDTNTGSWTQTEHVVLMPEERDELIDVLTSQQGYRTIKVGDMVGVGLIVLAVQYVNAAGGNERRKGTVLAWDDHKREYAVLTADPYGDLSYGTYTRDQQRATNAFATRTVEHLYSHFNASPPTLTFGHVAERDKLKG